MCGVLPHGAVYQQIYAGLTLSLSTNPRSFIIILLVYYTFINRFGFEFVTNHDFSLDEIYWSTNFTQVYPVQTSKFLLNNLNLKL